ncbi:MAG: GcrA family cell cycle regulator [Acetobacteraceae bacterium]
MEWTEESIQRLRAFWVEGLSTAEIGRRLGVSKNAVVGKAHRLELTARPSPIHWAAVGGPARPRNRRPVNAPKPEGPTLPPLVSAAPTAPAIVAHAVVAHALGVHALGAHAVGASVTVAPAVARPAPPPRQAKAPVTAAIPPAPRPAAPQPKLHAVMARSYGRVVTCCWPLGEPGTKSFRFCDAASVPGKPYCDEHAQIAYVKVRERREDAA